MRLVYLTMTLFFINIIIFSFLYHYTTGLDGVQYDFAKCIHLATMMQTATGEEIASTARYTRMVSTVQSIIAYAIAAGFISSMVHMIQKKRS